MNSSVQVPKWRQYLMSALFLLNFIGLAPENWSMVLFSNAQVDPMPGVAIAFYAAFSFLCLFGIRFPLKFTPLILIQLIYKSAWLVLVYLPAFRGGVIDDNLKSWFWPMAAGIIIDLLVIPWTYVYTEYLKHYFRLKSVN